MIESYDDKFLQEFEYETTAVSDGNIIGTCELGKAIIQLINEENQYSSLKGTWIKTIHGSFYIYDVKPVQEKVNIKLECYDIKYKLDTLYDKTKHTFPCTLMEWRNSIFDECNVEYDESTFPNSNLTLNKAPFIEEGASNRNVIQMIAQAGASWVETDEDDIFYFKWFTNTIHIVKDWSELTTEKNLSSAVNVVVSGRGDVEDNVYYPSEKPTNPIEFRIDNNYILDTQDESTTDEIRRQNITPIYNRVVGMQYFVFQLKAYEIENKLLIKLGDKIQYKDIWGNTLVAPIMKKKIVFIGGDPTNDDNYQIELSAEKIKETSTDFNYAASLKNDLFKVERRTNKIEGEIEDVVISVTDTTKKVTEAVQTVDGMKSTVSNIETNLNTQNDDISILKQQQTELSQSSTELKATVTDIQNNGVQTVKNTMVTVDIEGVKVSVDTDNFSSLMNNKGIFLYRYGNEIGKFTPDLTELDNITVRNYLVTGYHRIEKYTNEKGQKRTGFFWVGDR